VTIPEALQIAVQHHQAGRLAEAEALYRQILVARPNHPDALHLLGVIAHQGGRHALAVDWIRQSIAINPDCAVAHSNLGNALLAQGQLDEAVGVYRRLLQNAPDFPEAHNNLGAALRKMGLLDDAIASFRRAIQLKPNYPEAFNNLGNALRERGQLDDAIAAYRHALSLKPRYSDACNNLGNALRERGWLDEAIAACRQALLLTPANPGTHNNLGNALKDLGQFEEAIAAYRRALELRPDYPEAHNNLGNALKERGLFDQAIAACRAAIRLKPDFSEAHNNLGNALRDMGKPEEAIASYRRALELNPRSSEVHNNLGVALKDQGRFDEAIAAYRRALDLKPDSPDAHNNLANGLRDQGRLDDAIAGYRRALEIGPHLAWVHSNLIYALHFCLDGDERIAEEHQRWYQRFGEPVKRFILPHANDRDPNRRLRIGYVSPEFCDHVTGRYMVPLLEHHDREDFEILCYAAVARPDKLTERFRQLAQHWRSTVGLADEALAEMIRRDGVDILVDLTQHMAGNRLPMFARKPAPVQVSFAGYPDSAGLESIEYRISDRWLEGACRNEDEKTREKVYWVDSFWCYDPCGAELEVNSLPAIESGRVTFGCLNNFCKVNEPLIDLWAEALSKVTHSRLLLLSPVGSHRQRTLEAFERKGIDASHVEFFEFRPRSEYLRLYHQVDIALDSFPCNGHTTSLDSLWMGVPVVSLAGNSRLSRAGLSQLTNLGMPELVARSEAEYVRIAEGLARDLPRLSQIRSTLRRRMEASVLMDAPRFTRQIEQAYRKMWMRWCAG
jgi:predicted O-linked N-acetylglucosamine transferase (SPINDLY family)